MADVKQLIIDARVLKILAVDYPELVEEAQSHITPLMNDLIRIREIYDYTCSIYQPKANYTHKLLFIAFILRLFNPDALIIDCKLRNGLRNELAICLGDSGSNSSYYIAQARAYMKIKTFKASVASLTTQYLQHTAIV